MKRMVTRLHRELRVEKKETESIDRTLRELLALSVERYLDALSYGDTHNLCIYRLIQLLIENRSNDDICRTILVRFG